MVNNHGFLAKNHQKTTKILRNQLSDETLRDRCAAAQWSFSCHQFSRPEGRVEAGDEPKGEWKRGLCPRTPVFVGLWASPGLRLMIAVGK